MLDLSELLVQLEQPDHRDQLERLEVLDRVERLVPLVPKVRLVQLAQLEQLALSDQLAHKALPEDLRVLRVHKDLLARKDRQELQE